jgi:hypothetical protein
MFAQQNDGLSSKATSSRFELIERLGRTPHSPKN